MMGAERGYSAPKSRPSAPTALMSEHGFAIWHRYVCDDVSAYNQLPSGI